MKKFCNKEARCRKIVIHRGRAESSLPLFKFKIYSSVINAIEQKYFEWKWEKEKNHSSV